MSKDTGFNGTITNERQRERELGSEKMSNEKGTTESMMMIDERNLSGKKGADHSTLYPVQCANIYTLRSSVHLQSLFEPNRSLPIINCPQLSGTNKSSFYPKL